MQDWYRRGSPPFLHLTGATPEVASLGGHPAAVIKPVKQDSDIHCPREESR